MSTFGDIALSRKSTAEQVADGLAGKIMRGELRPGEPIRESVIATTLGVSRNTVRESMRLLEQSSLITYEFNRGAVVKEPSRQELRELYHARHLLEVAAVRTHTPHPDALHHMHTAFDHLVEAAHAGDPTTIVSSDLAFHTTLVALAGSTRVNRYFSELVRELTFYLMVLTVGEREYERPEDIIEEHRIIVDAIAAGDTDRAAALVAQHIDSNERRVHHLLKTQTP